MKVKFLRTVSVDFERGYGDIDDVTYRQGQVVEADKVENIGNTLVDMFMSNGVALGIPIDAVEVET